MSDNKSGSRNYFIFASIFIIMSFFIVHSFLSGILWGGLIALSVWPIFEKFAFKKRYFIRQGVENNAVLFTLIFSIFFLLPVGYALYQLTGIYGLISSYVTEHTVGGVLTYPTWFEHLPLKERIITLWNHNIATSQGFTDLVSKFNADKIFSIFTAVWGQLFDRIMTVVVMTISLYFMLKNGKKVKDNYQDIFSYWINDKSLVYVDKGIQAVRDTINGVILIGILEGLLLAIPLMLSGISAGFVIGLVAGIMGVLPLLMPALILPFIFYLFFNGDTTWAVITAVDLAIVWFVFENVVKPQMISRTIKINTFIILIAMIGGLELLGPVGLFLGPAIVAMAIGMMQDLLIVPKEFESRVDDNTQEHTHDNPTVIVNEVKEIKEMKVDIHTSQNKLDTPS